MAMRTARCVRPRILRSTISITSNRNWVHPVQCAVASNDAKSGSRWSKMGKMFSKPMSMFGRKKKGGSEENGNNETNKKRVKTIRAGKRALPSADEGVMQHIPREKAQILNILQEECDLYPDEVFPLFPDNKVEDILVRHQEHGDSSIEFAPLTKAIAGTSTDMTNMAHSSDVDSIEQTQSDKSRKKQIDVASKDETQRIAIGKIDTIKVPASDAIDTNDGSDTSDTSEDTQLATRDSHLMKSDDSGSEIIKTKEDGTLARPLTAWQRRQSKMSQISLDTRLQRELDPFMTFRETKILTPDEVSLMHQKDTKWRKERETSMMKMQEKMVMEQETKEGKSRVHQVWNQDPDNVYEIIQMLVEHGFKSDQDNTVWPYIEFEHPGFSKMNVDKEMNEMENDNSKDNDENVKSNELAIVDKSFESSGLNPAPNKFNDFYLLFSRFPEILTMELNDIRRKLYVLQQFTISDIRIVLLKDPRILRRPAHHLRLMLEILDEYYVEDFNKIVEYSPYFLSSTSKKELKKRIHFIYNQVLKPQKQRENLELAKQDGKLLYSVFQKQFLDIDRRESGFEIDTIDGKVMQNEMAKKERKHVNNQTVYKNKENENIKQFELKLNDTQKREIAAFIENNPDVIGNATADRMSYITHLLRNQLGFKKTELNELLNEYPELLTVSPNELKRFVIKLKRDGIRDIKSHILTNIHDVLILGGANAAVLESQTL